MKRKFSAASVAGCLCAVAALATGCGSDTKTDSTSASTSGATPSTASTSAAIAGNPPALDAPASAALGAKAGKAAADGGPVDLAPKTVAFLNLTSQATALRRVSEGFAAAAAAIGWKFTTCDAAGTPQKVAECASSFLLKKVDAIGSTAINSSLDKAQMKQAKAAGVPWLNVGGQNPPDPLFAGSFFEPESELYHPLNEMLLDALGTKPAQIGTLQLTVDDTARARYEQLLRDLKGHPNVSIAAHIEGQPANPAAVSPAIQAMLKQHPDIKGIWSCCDILTSPIVQGVHQAGLTGDKQPLIVAPFPDQAMLQSIRDGDIYAAVDLPWEAYGWIAVDELAQNAAHKTPFTEHGAPTQYPAALYGGQYITQKNVQQDPKKLQAPLLDYAAYFKAKWKAQFTGAS